MSLIVLRASGVGYRRRLTVGHSSLTRWLSLTEPPVEDRMEPKWELLLS
jgi:hypothetical protein